MSRPGKTPPPVWRDLFSSGDTGNPAGRGGLPAAAEGSAGSGGDKRPVR